VDSLEIHARMNSAADGCSLQPSSLLLGKVLTQAVHQTSFGKSMNPIKGGL